MQKCIVFANKFCIRPFGHLARLRQLQFSIKRKRVLVHTMQQITTTHFMYLPRPANQLPLHTKHRNHQFCSQKIAGNYLR